MDHYEANLKLERKRCQENGEVWFVDTAQGWRLTEVCQRFVSLCLIFGSLRFSQGVFVLVFKGRIQLQSHCSMGNLSSRRIKSQGTLGQYTCDFRICRTSPQRKQLDVSLLKVLSHHFCNNFFIGSHRPYWQLGSNHRGSGKEVAARDQASGQELFFALDA